MKICIDSSTLKNKHLNMFDALLYSLIDNCRLKDNSSPVHSYMFKEFGWSDKKIKDSLDKLSSLGMIKDYTYQKGNLLATLPENEDDINSKVEKAYKNQANKASKDKTAQYNEQIEIIVSYLNKVLSSHYRASSKSLRNKVATLLSQGFTVDDFTIVIDKKYNEWHDTEWAKYLRPSTLFSQNHFMQYLNQPEAKTAMDKLREKEEERQNSDSEGW